MKFRALLILLGTALPITEALALPEFAVRSVRRCDTCHVEPTGWNDPDTSERKCSLNCNTCHVSPTGGGMRNASGLYFQQYTLPMFKLGDAAAAYKEVELAPSSQPAVVDKVPAPGTPGRYNGIDPNPRFQIGTDVRFMSYFPLGDDEDSAFFPMQTDLYLAFRPYNPKKLNKGRLTMLVNAGFQGSRGEEFDGFADRAFVREWWAMYHDLPNQLYARAGRFLPAHGWRLDDHTVFTRKPQNIFGQGFDFERQVTGVEVGINPNYLYLHASVFNAADEWDRPIDGDGGIGAAVSAGWRDLGWHAGGSFIGGTRDEDTLAALSAQWAVHISHYFPAVPLIYLGEYHLNSVLGEEDNRHGLAAFHEIEALVVEGLRPSIRYNWLDSDVNIKNDTAHRVDFNVRWVPIAYLEVIAAFRHAWTNTDDRFEKEGDDVFVQLHGMF